LKIFRSRRDRGSPVPGQPRAPFGERWRNRAANTPLDSDRIQPCTSIRRRLELDGISQSLSPLGTRIEAPMLWTHAHPSPNRAVAYSWSWACSVSPAGAERVTSTKAVGSFGVRRVMDDVLADHEHECALRGCPYARRAPGAPCHRSSAGEAPSCRPLRPCRARPNGTRNCAPEVILDGSRDSPSGSCSVARLRAARGVGSSHTSPAASAASFK
jgi:hypothetical protein